MFHFFGNMLGLAIAIASSMLGYWQARQFTQNKLRFVDGVHKMGVPFLAGLGAALVAMPVVWILPLVGTGTALLFGLGVALGVSAGDKSSPRNHANQGVGRTAQPHFVSGRPKVGRFSVSSVSGEPCAGTHAR